MNRGAGTSRGGKIRVMRIIGRMNVGGPAIHAGILCNLPSESFQTLIIHGSLAPGESDMSYLLEGMPVQQEMIPELGRAIRPCRDGVALIKLWRLMKLYRPHIIHTHTAKAGGLGRLAGVLFRYGNGHRDCRLVHTLHGHLFEGYFTSIGSRAAVVAERGLAHLCHRILTVSEKLRADLVERFCIAPSEKVSVVPLGLDLDPFFRATRTGRFRSELGVGEDTFLVGCVGRLVPVKNHRLLFNAARLILKQNCGPIVFVLIGGGESLTELQELAAELDIAKHVRFVGWRRNLEEIYPDLDVFVLTSLNEGTPVSLIEAMASGQSVVATSVGGIPDVVERGVTGLLVPSGDAAAFADALTRLKKDAAMRIAFGEAGREHVHKRYGKERLIQQVTTIYRELLAS